MSETLETLTQDSWDIAETWGRNFYPRDIEQIEERRTWLAHEEARELVARSDELEALCEQFGFYPDINRHTGKVIAELKSLLGAETGKPTNPARFQELLNELMKEYESVPHTWIPADWEVGRECLVSTDDDAKRLEEQVAYQSPERARITRAWLENRREALETIGGLRKQIEKEHPHAGAIRRLLSYLEPIGANPITRFLERLVYCRRKYRLYDTEFFRDEFLELAREYIENTSLHCNWLTGYIVTSLIDAELTPKAKVVRWPDEHRRVIYVTAGLILAFVSWRPGLVNGHFSAWASLALVGLYVIWRWLKAYRFLRTVSPVREELASGLYDPEEIARRLRRLEERGLYMPSLTYQVLRVGKSASPKSPEEPATEPPQSA